MTVSKLREILSIVDPDTEVKIKINTWDLRDKDCFVASVSMSTDENGELIATLHHGVHEKVEDDE